MVFGNAKAKVKADVYGGFVSNVGNIVTIHIKDKYMEINNEIRYYFGIYGKKILAKLL